MRLEDIDGERGERQPRQHRRQRLRSTDTESKASEPRRKRGEQNGGPAPAGQGRQGIGKVARRPAPGVKAPRQFHFPNKPSLHQPSPPNCASSHSNSETGDQLPREDRANAAPVSRKARGLDFSDDDEDEDRPESQVANGAPVSRKARGLDFSDDDEDEDRPETQVPMAQVDRRDNGDDDNSGDTTESDETVDPDADRQPKVRDCLCARCSVCQSTRMRFLTFSVLLYAEITGSGNGICQGCAGTAGTYIANCDPAVTYAVVRRSPTFPSSRKGIRLPQSGPGSAGWKSTILRRRTRTATPRLRTKGCRGRILAFEPRCVLPSRGVRRSEIRSAPICVR
jgi:hypothetical protein